MHIGGHTLFLTHSRPDMLLSNSFWTLRAQFETIYFIRNLQWHEPRTKLWYFSIIVQLWLSLLASKISTEGDNCGKMRILCLLQLLDTVPPCTQWALFSQFVAYEPIIIWSHEDKLGNYYIKEATFLGGRAWDAFKIMRDFLKLFMHIVYKSNYGFSRGSEQNFCRPSVHYTSLLMCIPIQGVPYILATIITLGYCT
jgi:hypothetical protein